MSGPHTDIVSRDLLRGHRFVLKHDNLKMIFQRWQWQHQWKVFGNKRSPFIQVNLVNFLSVWFLTIISKFLFYMYVFFLFIFVVVCTI